MKRSRKSNRVSWASGFNLCQVKLFLSEESPCEVGMDYQYHLRAKPSLMSHSNINESQDLPPGFESSQHMNIQREKEQHCIPQVTWKCPPRFTMNPNWHVVAGEESEELVVQKLREMRVLEAVYPRISAIPPCPVGSLEVEEGNDDHLTPLIPIIPIEELEEEVIETPSIPNKIIVNSLPQSVHAPQTTKPILSAPLSPAKEKSVFGASQCLRPEFITAAASAALTMKSEEIDTQLLMKIFSDPKMIDSLTKDFGAGAKARTMNTATTTTTINTVSAPVSELKQATRPIHLVSPKPGIMVEQLKPVSGMVGHLRNDRMEPNYTVTPVSQPSTNTAPLGPNYLIGSVGPSPQSKGNQVPSMMMPGNRMVPNPSLPMLQPCHVREADYYKNLIKRHGGDNQERLPGGPQFPLDNHANNQFQNHDTTQNVKTGEMRPLNQKLCAYFNGPKGCKKGASCNFRHEMAMQKRAGLMMDARNAKRTRLGGEIIGRT